jgi:DHA2 family multidrug resistance protein
MRLDYKWRAAIVVAIGLFMAVLDNTIVNVALPQMQSAFNTNRTTITWVVTGYFLAQAAVIPVTGYLSDRLGTKLVFATALVLFTVGSALCAFTPQIQPYLSFAPGEQLLIAFRVLQGIGGGALFPIAFAIVFRVFPPDQRGPASAVVGVPVLLAPAFGPTIGGYLTTTFDWSAIFTVNIPIGIVALLLVLLVLRGRRAERAADGIDDGAGAAAGAPAPARKRFDVVGLLLAMAGFTALVYGISEAGPNGWSDPTVDAYLIAGGVLLVAFVITELIVSDPVIDVRLFLNYTFTSANVLTWAVSGLLFGSLFLMPIFFEQVQNNDALTTGEILISQGLAAALATVIAGRFYNRVGPRLLIALGFVFITAGTYGFTQLDTGTSGWSLQVWLVLRGLGLGFTNIPLQTLTLSVVSNRAMARASSLMNVTRQVFGAVGVSILTAYLIQQATGYADGLKTTFQNEQLASVRTACIQQFGPNATAVANCIQQHAQAYVSQHAATMALNDTFFATLIGTAVCIVLALLVGRDPALRALRQARKRGEAAAVERQPVMVGE